MLQEKKHIAWTQFWYHLLAREMESPPEILSNLREKEISQSGQCFEEIIGNCNQERKWSQGKKKMWPIMDGLKFTLWWRTWEWYPGSDGWKCEAWRYRHGSCYSVIGNIWVWEEWLNSNLIRERESLKEKLRLKNWEPVKEIIPIWF